MRRIFIDHGEAYGNLGDEAMLQSALARLSRHLSPVRFVVPREGSRPLPAFARYDVEEVPSPYRSFVRVCETALQPFWVRKMTALARREGLGRHVFEADLLARTGRLAAADPDFRAFHKALTRSDGFYGVGAADFNDFNLTGGPYKAWLYRVARRAVPVVCVAAQGFGPLENPELGDVMRQGFAALDVLTFRDHAFSQAFTRSLGNLSCEMRVVGDEAFSLPAADASRSDAALAAAGLAPDDSFVAVHWRATDYTQDTVRFIPNLARACDLVVRHCRAKLLFVPMSYDVHSGDDAALVGTLRDAMDCPESLLALPLQHDAGLIKAVIGRSLFTLGLSYHVHVFGLSQGRPALILYTGAYYRYKSEGLIGFYGPPSAAFDLAQTSVAELEQAVIATITGLPGASAAIDRVNARILIVNDWTITRMAELLSGAGR